MLLKTPSAGAVKVSYLVLAPEIAVFVSEPCPAFIFTLPFVPLFQNPTVSVLVKAGVKVSVTAVFWLML